MNFISWFFFLKIFSGRIDVLDDTNAIPKLNYYFVPIIIITLVTYFIADVFFGVYEMGVDTLFLCFLEVEHFSFVKYRMHLKKMLFFRILKETMDHKKNLILCQKTWKKYSRKWIANLRLHQSPLNNRVFYLNKILFVHCNMLIFRHKKKFFWKQCFNFVFSP